MTTSTMAICVQVSMKTLSRMIQFLSPQIPLCIRGPHGIGKSTSVHDGAKEMRDSFYSDPANAAKWNWSFEQGLPVIERRLSQLTEGDLTGMPSLDADRRTTVFKPCDWLIDACDRPVVLFLDERNRALEGVKQAVFQIMDSRAFYGHKLHPGTRVIVAENVGDIYNVQQYDPAEVSRAATVELVPTVDELLQYMTKIGCDERTIAFLSANHNHVEYNPNLIEKGRPAFDSKKKYPDRRAWVRLDTELQKLGLLKDTGSDLFYPIVASMVGIEAASAYVKFVREYKYEVSAEDILTSWEKAKSKLDGPPSATKWLDLINIMASYLQKNKVTATQAKQIRLFMIDMPAEHRMKFFGIVQKNSTNVVTIADAVADVMLQTAMGVQKNNGNQPSKG